MDASTSVGPAAVLWRLYDAMRSVTLSSNAEMRSCVSVTRFIENDTRTTSSDPSHAELST